MEEVEVEFPELEEEIQNIIDLCDGECFVRANWSSAKVELVYELDD